MHAHTPGGVPARRSYSLTYSYFTRRGNAYKALNFFAEAISSYQDALDEAPLDTADGRLIHSYALNNLGAVSQVDTALYPWRTPLTHG